MTLPALCANTLQSEPNSYDMTTPVTTPIANEMAKILTQKR